MSIGQTVAEIAYGDSSIFQDGSRPPFWICDARVWTTHEGHLVVFITVQNLFGIDSSVDNTQVFIFCDLDLKTPIYATKIRGWGFDALNGEQSHRDPHNALPARKHAI